jgi:hypothetical protein
MPGAEYNPAVTDVLTTWVLEVAARRDENGA